MGTIIEFRNTNFGYDNMNTFNDFNMEIEEGDIVTLVGPTGSGKTTLLKMLCHKLPNDSIYYQGINMTKCNIDDLRKNVITIFDIPFKTDSIVEELSYYLRNLKIAEEVISEKVQSIIQTFNLNMTEKPLNMLSSIDEYLIKILRFLIIEPKFLAIDNIFSNLSNDYKIKVINYIKEHNMTLLNVNSDLDNALLGNKLFVLENFVLILLSMSSQSASKRFVYNL